MTQTSRIIIRIALLLGLLSAIRSDSAVPPQLFQWQQRSPTVQDSTLRTVAGGDGKYFAAGDNGYCLLSTNLLDWSEITTPMTNVSKVTYGAGRFVALSEFRSISTSQDGRSWVEKVSYWSSTNTIKDIAFGNGIFCAVTSTNSTITSTDGLSWTTHAAALPGAGSHLDFVNGQFAVSSGNNTSLSTDGITWTTINNTGVFSSHKLVYLNGHYFKISYDTKADSCINLTVNNVWNYTVEKYGTIICGGAYGNGKYVIVDSGAALVSEDFITWTDYHIGDEVDFAGGKTVEFIDGRFVVVGENGSVFSSADGMVWVFSGKRAGNQIFNTAHLAIDYVFDRFLISDYYGYLISSNGVDWQSIERRAGWGFKTVCHSDNLVVGIGPYSSVRTSTNLIDWSEGVSLDSGYILNSVTYGGGAYVTVGQGGRIFTSPNGVNWTRQTSGRTEDLNDITYGNNRFVAVGAGGAILTSTNLTSWDYRRIGGTSRLTGVAFGGGKFVAVGASVVVNSVYGTNWALSSWSTSGLFNSVKYFKNRFFFTFGDSIYTSMDANTFTLLLQTTNSTMSRIMYGRGGVVVLGEAGKILQSGRFSTDQPILGASQLLADGSFQINVAADEHRGFLIEHTDDLLTWNISSSWTNKTSNLVVTNGTSLGAKSRFYRVLYPD
jgi:hypothetical protein